MLTTDQRKTLIHVSGMDIELERRGRGQPLLLLYGEEGLEPEAPFVDELAKDYTGKIKVGKMDVDSNSATPMRYGVRGIPTLLVFKGGQVKEQIVGYVPKETIQKAIDKHV